MSTSYGSRHRRPEDTTANTSPLAGGRMLGAGKFPPGSYRASVLSLTEQSEQARTLILFGLPDGSCHAEYFREYPRHLRVGDQATIKVVPVGGYVAVYKAGRVRAKDYHSGEWLSETMDNIGQLYNHMAERGLRPAGTTTIQELTDGSGSYTLESTESVKSISSATPDSGKG